MVHKPGTKNVIPDYLSRNPKPQEGENEEVEPIPKISSIEFVKRHEYKDMNDPWYVWLCERVA